MEADPARLIERSVNCLAARNTKEIALPCAFAQIARAQPQGELKLRNRFIEIDHRGEFRGVAITAPKINIAAQFFFPDPRWQLPVFSMEMVVLGAQPMVALVDAKCLLPGLACAAAVDAALDQAHRDFPGLEPAADPPQWYADCRSGRDFFIRPKDRQALQEFSMVQLRIWQAVVALLHDPVALDAGQVTDHAARLVAYKDHHRVNSPGVPLLTRSFGGAWTQEYLARYLFR
jgi:Ferredoxin-dependent bilin reductase